MKEVGYVDASRL